MLTGAPTRTPCELIRLTLLPGRLVGSPAHGRATATMPAAAATARAEPIASKRGASRAVAPRRAPSGPRPAHRVTRARGQAPHRRADVVRRERGGPRPSPAPGPEGERMRGGAAAAPPGRYRVRRRVARGPAGRWR